MKSKNKNNSSSNSLCINNKVNEVASFMMCIMFGITLFALALHYAVIIESNINAPKPVDYMTLQYENYC